MPPPAETATATRHAMIAPSAAKPHRQVGLAAPELDMTDL
jgi:hypothetical protein